MKVASTARVSARSGGLAEARLVIVAGKGGVGRTTVAAALSVLASGRGRRVLLCQTRARDALGPLLGAGEVGNDIAPAGPNLCAVNIDPRAALREYGMMALKFPAVYRAVFENRPLRAFLRAVPGLYEFAMLGKVCHHVTEKKGRSDRFDTVVFDGPATGHLIQMLGLPRAVLGAISAGPLAREARAADELLRDPGRTVAHIVTLAEEMPVAEAADLHRALHVDLAIPTGRVIVNRLFPDRWRSDGAPGRVLERLEATAPGGDLADLVSNARQARARREMQEEQIARLRAAVPLGQVHVPMLFAPAIGAAEVRELANILDAQDRS